MELDRSIFSSVEHAIRTNPTNGLNGQLDKLREQLNMLGTSASEFTKNTLPGQRNVVRRAVKAALGLTYLPNNAEVVSALNDLYAGAELIGTNPEIRQRVHIFARYIGSSAP